MLIYAKSEDSDALVFCTAKSIETYFSPSQVLQVSGGASTSLEAIILEPNSDPLFIELCIREWRANDKFTSIKSTESNRLAFRSEFL